MAYLSLFLLKRQPDNGLFDLVSSVIVLALGICHSGERHVWH
jgi:hypothetical protein